VPTLINIDCGRAVLDNVLAQGANAFIKVFNGQRRAGRMTVQGHARVTAAGLQWSLGMSADPIFGWRRGSANDLCVPRTDIAIITWLSNAATLPIRDGWHD
jgi:hypothetical protein